MSPQCVSLEIVKGLISSQANNLIRKPLARDREAAGGHWPQFVWVGMLQTVPPNDG